MSTATYRQFTGIKVSEGNNSKETQMGCAGKATILLPEVIGMYLLTNSDSIPPTFSSPFTFYIR